MHVAVVRSGLDNMGVPMKVMRHHIIRQSHMMAIGVSVYLHLSEGLANDWKRSSPESEGS